MPKFKARKASKDSLLDDTPEEILNELLNSKFTAEYSKYIFVPSLNTYRHCLHVKENDAIIGKLGRLLNKHDLDERSSVMVLPSGGVDILTNFETEQPFGIHEWQIYDCQVYSEPRYLLLSVRRTRTIQIKCAENWGINLYDVWHGVHELGKMAALIIIVLMEAVVQISTVVARIVEAVPPIITSLMPFLLALVDALNKCVGGLYLLINMMWRSFRQPPPQQPYYPTPVIRGRTPLRIRDRKPS